MKTNATIQETIRRVFLALGVSICLAATISPAFAGGGSGSGGSTSGGGSTSTSTSGGGSGSTSSVDTIKVSKAQYFDEYFYVELLIMASSSNSNAHLYAYMPDGTYLGEVQNGGGGRYGGTTFLGKFVPDTITIKSSAGGSTTVSTTPMGL